MIYIIYIVCLWCSVFMYLCESKRACVNIYIFLTPTTIRCNSSSSCFCCCYSIESIRKFERLLLYVVVVVVVVTVVYIISNE